ncbi:MAG: NADH-quinone oxidoreductase subunit NuoE [Alphaproteobacteria bacterium]|jgi:NADH-quinone oxidoreductase subunit E|nr:NADH-quinone oxidoreductase subunit NuoE [Alphaproteobacteria bacterium]MDP7222760.1 NADH-quinone oxidoreductase subunit NuoE [Alphaproteobacteria bacterium]
MRKPFDLNADYQPESFTFKSKKDVKDVLGRYPDYAKKSAVMPLLDLAQRQVAKEGAKADPVYGGWIPRAAMDEIARIIEQPPVKVYEVATFYSMYNLEPVGKYLVQVCTTTPCWLCGSSEVAKACEDELGIHWGETTKDGLFTLMEVECLGACVNAPMVQINDDYYEDLTPDLIVDVLRALRDGKNVPIGSQTGRRDSMAVTGPTTLTEQAKKSGVI